MIFKKTAQLPEERIDQIPVRASVFKARVISVAAILLAGPALVAARVGPPALLAFRSSNFEISTVFDQRGLTLALLVCFRLMAALGLVCAAIGALSFWHRVLTYRLLRSSLFVVYLLVALYAWLAWVGGGAILQGGDGAALEINGLPQDRATILLLWWRVCFPAFCAALYVGWLHVMLNCRAVVAAFCRADGEPLPGDYVLEDVRTHGRDPHYRRSVYRSGLTHLMILIVIPWMLQWGGCVEDYRVPKGSGEQVVAMVRMVQPQKKKQQKLSLRPDSAIIFEIPDLDQTEVDQVMEQQTVLTYVATPQARAGRMGSGGGTEGGWPAGMEDYRIRFIRLEHGGAGWDDGMDASNADVNFLRFFAQATGFTRVATRGESHPIAHLARYPRDGFPPFVFLTGHRNLGRIASRDTQILREYLLNGGMLIADAGSRDFHNAFVHFISRQVFPDRQLLDIADDDMLYQVPFRFPNGAPAFWHHGGRRALGVKHEGRWVVFYHPGDFHDAWKSQGYADVTPEMREAANNLGVNLLYYAFTQWSETMMKLNK